MNKEKLNGGTVVLLLGIGSITLIVGSLAFYLPKITSSEDFDSTDYIFFVGLLILIVGTVLIAIAKQRDLNKGLPLDDEFTQKVGYKAGYYSWLITIWISVLVMLLQDLLADILDITELTIEHFTGIIVLGSAISFLGLSYYLVKRGEVD